MNTPKDLPKAAMAAASSGTAGLTPATDPAHMQSSPTSRAPARGAKGSLAALHDHQHDPVFDPHTADGVPRPALRREDYAHIAGWGADLDRAQRPAVPMERMPARLDNVPPTQQQPLTVEVLHSNERPGITPVFGSTLPPRGLSGSMRRMAFKFSENDVRHWLALLAADRVNMVEGLLSDLARGHVPNIYAEMGGRAELRHNPAGAARKALVVGAVLGAGYLLWRRRQRRY
ncbi:MAG TPA: hypothetical protein VK570_20375 [Rubrivivax sp.]|nr:hypothetical protein [Rubrivivax sp.]